MENEYGLGNGIPRWDKQMNLSSFVDCRSAFIAFSISLYLLDKSQIFRLEDSASLYDSDQNHNDRDDK